MKIARKSVDYVDVSSLDYGIIIISIAYGFFKSTYETFSISPESQFGI